MKQFEITMFKINILLYYYYNRFGYIRIFGKGLKWKDTTIHRLMFSERNKITKGLQIGKWRIGILKNYMEL